MVQFAQMCKFMHHNIINQARGQFDQLYVQPYRTVGGATAPLGFCVRQFDGARDDIQPRREMRHALNKEFFGFELIPARHGPFYVFALAVINHEYP